MTVTIRGFTYKSVSEAARAIGVSRQAVLKAKQKGTLDYVGLGMRRGNLYVGFTFPGWEHLGDSLSKFAAAIGAHEVDVGHARKFSKKLDCFLGKEHAIVRYELNGKLYNSLDDMEKETGLSRTCIRAAMRVDKKLREKFE